MALVHMIFLDLGVTQFPKHPDPTNPQDYFLGKSVFFIAAVKVGSKPSIKVAILFYIRIKKDDGQGTSGYPNDIVLPGLYSYRPTLDLNLDFFRQGP